MTWVETQLVRRHVWAEGLISVTLDTVVSPFAPGQFVNLALDSAGTRIKRSYSLASAPGQPSEFYLSHVPGGSLTPGLFELKEGDRLWIDDRALGFFTLRHVPDARHLWLLATGTGLGPFVSMLRSPEIWRRFTRLVLVHGVRGVAHLGYREELERLAGEHGVQLTYIPLITREPPPSGALAGRLPALIASGELEQRAGLSLDPASTHVLLCGNPDMIGDVQALLAGRGMHKHRPRKPGHITTESYW